MDLRRGGVEGRAEAGGGDAEAGASAAGSGSEADFARLAPDGLKMILRTVEVVSGAVFLFLGRTPKGAMFSTTPCLMRPSSSKLAFACTVGSNHLCIKSREA
jgi:hypothetical protein